MLAERILRRVLPDLCRIGRHLPRDDDAAGAGGQTHSRCAICGQSLVRINGKWRDYVEGPVDSPMPGQTPWGYWQVPPAPRRLRPPSP